MSAQPLDDTAVKALVGAAAAAPSLHNAQPWRFRYLHTETTFELRADLGRTMPQTDPAHRALHLGCGAALFNLRVALAESGRSVETRLLPDPEILATVRLTDTGLPGPELAALHPAIARRHTSRHPFRQEMVPVDVQLALRHAARQEGAQLVFPGPWHVAALLAEVRDAEGRDTMDPERLAEVQRWTRVGAAVDGIPEYAFGPRKRDGGAPVRDFAGRRAVPDRPTAVFETMPNLALLGTAKDTPADWLRAGQAMERVLLLATAHGLSTALSSHSLERRDLRELARDPESDMGFVHMVFRLGYGPEGAVTPRRPVEDVLEIV